MSTIDTLSFTLALTLALGGLAFAFNYRTRISTVPVLLILGILAGPALKLIDHRQAAHLFDQVRVFGVVAILFAEGQSLQWPLLRRHLKTVLLLDTLGLLITAALAGLAFCWLFDAPLFIGLLFGAIVSATDPATLVPLFRFSPIDRDTETLIVAESIFNDPLGIVLTLLLVALILPSSDLARPVEMLATWAGTPLATVLYFLYVVLSALVLGVVLGAVTHWLAERFAMEEFAVLMGLSVALGGFVLGDVLNSSGYLVATVVGIVMGNHRHFFRHESAAQAAQVEEFLGSSRDFQNLTSSLATVLIFVLLGASLEPAAISAALLPALGVSVLLIVLIRPLSVLPVLLPLGWKPKPSLFVALEGPRGVVPAALAGLPLALGQQYNNPLLTHWGATLLSAVLVTVVTSVALETLWMDRLKRSLLEAT
ncbi:MAG: cation:proton antiporter [Chromatiales bacterium]|nr:cation:proton antiporter [Chromatiales bacterium]